MFLLTFFLSMTWHQANFFSFQGEGRRKRSKEEEEEERRVKEEKKFEKSGNNPIFCIFAVELVEF